MSKLEEIRKELVELILSKNTVMWKYDKDTLDKFNEYLDLYDIYDGDLLANDLLIKNFIKLKINQLQDEMFEIEEDLFAIYNALKRIKNDEDNL